MSYVRMYIDSRRKDMPVKANVRQYDLPGLANTLSATPEEIENYKREYNVALAALRNTSTMDEKEEWSWYAHMCKLLTRIGTYTEQEMQEGFHVDQSQCPF